MKNKELVKMLNNLDPEAEVIALSGDSLEGAPVTKVVSFPEKNSIELVAGYNEEEFDPEELEKGDELFEGLREFIEGGEDGAL